MFQATCMIQPISVKVRGDFSNCLSPSALYNSTALFLTWQDIGLLFCNQTVFSNLYSLLEIESQGSVEDEV